MKEIMGIWLWKLLGLSNVNQDKQKQLMLSYVADTLQWCDTCLGLIVTMITSHYANQTCVQLIKLEDKQNWFETSSRKFINYRKKWIFQCLSLSKWLVILSHNTYGLYSCFWLGKIPGSFLFILGFLLLFLFFLVVRKSCKVHEWRKIKVRTAKSVEYI